LSWLPSRHKVVKEESPPRDERMLLSNLFTPKLRNTKLSSPDSLSKPAWAFQSVANSKSLAKSEMLCFVDHHEGFYKRKVENIPKKPNKKIEN